MAEGKWAERVVEARNYVLSDHTVVPTGFPTIDERLRGGFAVGQAAMLLGRPEVGKTTLALNIIAEAVGQGHTAGVATLEMTAPEVVIRMLSIVLSKPVEEVFMLLKSESIEPELIDAQKALDNLYIWERSAPTWDDLLSWSYTFTPSVVLIDHLGLMARVGYSKGETERIQHLAQDSKRFAKDANVALLVIHEVGRGGEGEEKNHGHLRLSAADAKYGGEYDMDYILGLYRPEQKPNLTAGQRALVENKVYLQLLKNRHGLSHQEGVQLTWAKPTLRIEEL